MADEADIANDTAERWLLKAIADSRRPDGPMAIGRCLSCGAKFTDEDKTRRWCDADCRDEWQWRKDR